MERRERMRTSKVYGLLGLLLFSLVRDLSALSVTVNEVECVYEYVLYEGDTISGNFVVVDHDIFWSSDHPGIDFIVSCSPPLFAYAIFLVICALSFRCTAIGFIWFDLRILFNSLFWVFNFVFCFCLDFGNQCWFLMF